MLEVPWVDPRDDGVGCSAIRYLSGNGNLPASKYPERRSCEGTNQDRRGLLGLNHAINDQEGPIKAIEALSPQSP